MNQFQRTNKQMKKLRGIFFQIGLIIAGGLTLLAFEWKSSYIVVIPTNTDPVVSVEDWDIAPILPKKEVIKKVKVERPKVVIDPHQFTPVDNKTKIEEPIDVKKVVVTPVFNPNDWKIKEKEDPTPPVTWAEVMPKFVGGEKALFKYLGQAIKYPKMAIENNIVGTVYVQFIVGKSGKIRDVKILRGESELLNQEAIRVVKAMPKWKPGRQHGKRVSVIYNLPIKFAFKEG